MLQLVDDFLQNFIAEKIKWLKKHPIAIDEIFHTSKRDTLEKLKSFITNNKVNIIIGYPKTQTILPAYVITLAPENEQPMSLGDEAEQYDSEGIGDLEEITEQKAVEKLSEFVSATYMNANYRIECWSDNGDLTSYMYIILKWALWASRKEMLSLGWVNITVSGIDLEPVPDYLPMFIYRRTAQITMMYENLYFEDLDKVGELLDAIANPEDYHIDEDGNLVDKDGNIIVEGDMIWKLNPHYYSKPISASNVQDILRNYMKHLKR